MWAGTVVEPLGPTSAAIDSVTSRSRSVALQASFELSALISTLARIGMVLRRSTTRWTWPSDFNSAARSTVTFMLQPVCSAGKSQRGERGWRVRAVFARVITRGTGTYPRDLAGVSIGDPGTLSVRRQGVLAAWVSASGNPGLIRR